MTYSKLASSWASKVGHFAGDAARSGKLQVTSSLLYKGRLCGQEITNSI